LESTLFANTLWPTKISGSKKNKKIVIVSKTYEIRKAMYIINPGDAATLFLSLEGGLA
jgi:hypothetical protein